MVNYTAGDRLLIKSVQETIATSITYIALKQIRLDRGGTLRISFKLRRVGGSLSVYGRVYRNGSAVGTERSTTSTSGDTYTQDISGWSAGDRIQVYGRTSDAISTTVGVSELRVSCGNWYGLVED
jgi:hypothetical protein